MCAYSFLRLLYWFLWFKRWTWSEQSFFPGNEPGEKGGLSDPPAQTEGQLSVKCIYTRSHALTVPPRYGCLKFSLCFIPLTTLCMCRNVCECVCVSYSSEFPSVCLHVCLSNYSVCCVCTHISSTVCHLFFQLIFQCASSVSEHSEVQSKAWGLEHSEQISSNFFQVSIHLMLEHTHLSHMLLSQRCP